MTSELLLQQLANGISLGSLYALLAIGYTMVYGILRLINFAHGDIFMMAAYFMVFSIVTFRLPWYIAIVVVIIVTIALGVLLEKTAYKPLRNAPRMSIMISAIGASFLLENLATYLFTGVPRGFPDIRILTTTVELGSLSLTVATLITPFVTLILLYVVLFITNKTKIGMAMRAVSKDFETAKLMGININQVISTTFVIGSALAAVGAILWGSRYPSVMPLMGVMPGLKCFIAAVLGGIGNATGAVLGGFILGMAEIMLITFLPSLTGYRDAMAFVILIVVLLVKPTGLLGEKVTDKV
ncbi:MAG: branched-chain amino acid ABC transporter permease [Tissierellia bacterium]|jgi:branched-chain amino acid transport system permease protein|nr:branched-chain amino acid ABC transporter permease [Tissierellia bacterium]MDD3226270.1 branched-chain amino acid ABC transporter permease [Tissierellia bacterium]MDD3752034.1 branched-chain amino acid ABC transporter permease [Tissierellia bacterium]MDD4045996.1 branched-chain amino acid ABC transporter permease [Tissierellia bacterium]MDD4678400.1 branched-chain amino acid ABC transporter permease [Tissierellia bacterium]